MQDSKERVLAYIDEHREQIIAFLQELIRIPSVNPWFHERPAPSYEDQVQRAIAEKLEPLGAVIDRWEPDAEELAEYAGKPGYVPDRDYSGRTNQAAVIKGTGGGRSLMLTSRHHQRSARHPQQRRPQYWGSRSGRKVSGNNSSAYPVW